MKHENLTWNAATRKWFCKRCGRTSDNASVFEAQAELEQFECRLPARGPPSAAPGTETVRLIKKPFKMTPRVERSGCRFLVVETDHGPEIKLELLDDAPSLTSLSIGFEMLRGATLAQARTIVDAMNERIEESSSLPNN